MTTPANPWDQRYAQVGFYYGTEPNDVLRENASLIREGGRVLCLAEGEGRNAVYLAGLGYDVTAVDGSAVGLDKMNRLAHERDVRVASVVSDLAQYDPGRGRWDGIVSIWCHLPKDLRRTVHRQCVEALAPAGVMILEAYTPKQLEFKTGGPPTPLLMMTLSELQEEFQGLELVVAREIERDVQEGVGHHGRSAVVQVVARKRST